MDKYLTLFINGDPFHYDSSMSLQSILLYLDFDPDSILVEYNNQIIDKRNFNALFFQHNDSIEIITAVGGG